MPAFRQVLEQLRDQAERMAGAPPSERHDVGRIREYQELFAAAERLLEALDTPETSAERLALLAYCVGDLASRAELRALGPELHAGFAVRRGGRAGAARAHGPHAERTAEWERWRARFAELRRKFPEAQKKTLIGMIQTETGATVRTLRRRIGNLR
jgi:hypothetical protein